MRLMLTAIVFVDLCVQAIVSNAAYAQFKPPYQAKITTLIELDEWEAKHCLAKYNREVERSKELTAKNGSMTDFFYAQRRLRRKYFEPTAERMVYEQKFIDVWESFDIGQLDYRTAMNYTLKIMNEGYNSKEILTSCQ